MIELNREEKSSQTFSAIAKSNRITVVEIRLKRADRLSDGFDSDLKEIRDSIHELTDSLIIGEDVRSSLEIIEERVTQLEQRLDA